MKAQTYSLNPDILNQLKFNSSETISGTLFERLRNMIINGQLPAGFVFPNETTFCDQLGVGRTTLREAYKALESAGFITRTKRGTYVNSVQQINEAMPFSMIIRMSDFSELLEFRLLFEGELASLAAKRATDVNIRNLNSYLEKMRESKNDLHKLTQYDTMFHLEIAYASQNKFISNTFSLMSDTLYKFVFNAFQIDTENNVAQALDYHQKILDAIIARDDKAAKKAMKDHVHEISRRGDDVLKNISL